MSHIPHGTLRHIRLSLGASAPTWPGLFCARSAADFTAVVTKRQSVSLTKSKVQAPPRTRVRTQCRRTVYPEGMSLRSRWLRLPRLRSRPLHPPKIRLRGRDQ
jgi:hypothetical protein